MFIASIDTRRFSFMAAGATEEEATDALMSGRAVHCEQTGADPDYLSKDDLAVLEVRNGLCYRDSEVLPLAGEVPAAFKYWSCDEVAECVEGLSSTTVVELWERVSAAVEAGTAKPLGGDGSNGTTEEPIVSSGEYGTDMAAAWSTLSFKAQSEIRRAALKYKKQWETHV